MASLVKNLIVVLILIVLGFFAFRYMTRAPSAEVNALSHIEALPGATATSTNPADEFSRLLDRLNDVDFQKNAKGGPIFQDPLFSNSLINFTRPLPLIDKSRQNPFAPLDGNPAQYIKYPPASLSGSASFPIVGSGSSSPTSTASTTRKTR